MDIVWDGIARDETVDRSESEIRHALADAAKQCDWPRVIELASARKDLVNSSRLGGSTLFAPLHQAAYGGAPRDIAQQLIDLGAWRTLRISSGERPVDVAERMGHCLLTEVLTPQLKHIVPMGLLQKIQSHFHDVIRGRAEQLVTEQALRLPELEPLLELDRPNMWFPIPGMYGGFSYWLETFGADATLISESWCRVVGGSGQRHEITSAGSRLVDEGFA